MSMLEKAVGLSLRERKKRDKKQRLREAARALFADKGFEGTSTREICEAAEVGAGTLYSYFEDKRALLVHLFAEDITAAVQKAFDELDEDTPLLDALVHIFSACYDYYGRDLQLASSIVQAMVSLRDAERAELNEVTAGFIDRLAARVENAKARQEVRCDVPSVLAAMTLFGQYFFLLVTWLSGSLPREQVTTFLRQSLQMQLDGIGNRTERS